jgi:hypothetical protein
MGRRLRGGSDMQARNGNLIISDPVGSTDTQDTWGLQQEMRDLGGGWGDINGEPRRTEVTDAGVPTKLSKVVAVSVLQGVEQICAGGWEGVAGVRAGHILRRKEAVTASIANQR